MMRWAERRPWVWSFLAAGLVWALTSASVGGQGAFASLAVALEFATFAVIVGLGQMLVITAGPGNIDLSIPGVMTLAAYLATGLAKGTDGGLAAGLAAGLAVGLAAGLFNLLLIQGLAIPPMVGTLAAGFIFQSMAIAYSRHSHAKPAPALVGFVNAHLLGLPLVTLVFVGVSALVAQMLRRTVFGRSLLAIGQNRRAARLTGLAVGATVGLVYVLAGLCSALAGILLAANSGGAALNMGSDYLLSSIAVVVLGGTAIAGGQAVPAGLWGAAALLDLIVTMLNVLHVGAGLRYVVTGLIIIAVLALARGRAP